MKSEDMIKQLEDEKQWLEQESKRLVDESEKKLESVRAAELQELRRGKVEALQLLQVSHVLLYMYYYKMGWFGGVMVATSDLRSRGRGFDSWPFRYSSNNSGQVVHTHVPLSPSSILWYRSKMLRR